MKAISSVVLIGFDQKIAKDEMWLNYHFTISCKPASSFKKPEDFALYDAVILNSETSLEFPQIEIHKIRKMIDDKKVNVIRATARNTTEIAGHLDKWTETPTSSDPDKGTRFKKFVRNMIKENDSLMPESSRFSGKPLDKKIFDAVRREFPGGGHNKAYVEKTIQEILKGTEK